MSMLRWGILAAATAAAAGTGYMAYAKNKRIEELLDDLDAAGILVNRKDKRIHVPDEAAAATVRKIAESYGAVMSPGDSEGFGYLTLGLDSIELAGVCACAFFTGVILADLATSD